MLRTSLHQMHRAIGLRDAFVRRPLGRSSSERPRTSVNCERSWLEHSQALLGCGDPDGRSVLIRQRHATPIHRCPTSIRQMDVACQALIRRSTIAHGLQAQVLSPAIRSVVQRARLDADSLWIGVTSGRAFRRLRPLGRPSCGRFRDRRRSQPPAPIRRTS